MKILICTAALAMITVTTLSPSDGLYKYSYEKEIGENNNKYTIVVESVNSQSQQELEKGWEMLYQEILQDIDKF